MRKCVIALVLLMVAAVAVVWMHTATAAKDAKPADDAPFRAAERAMAKLKIDDAVGFNEVLTAEGLPHSKAGLDQIKTFRAGAAQRVGQPLGQVELVAREKIGASYARFTYLERYDGGSLIWSLTFYQGADGWKAVQIDWGADIRPLFQKS